MKYQCMVCAHEFDGDSETTTCPRCLCKYCIKPMETNEVRPLLTVNDLRKVYAEKLIEKNSHDAAFTKAIWVAFESGIHLAGGTVSDRFKKAFLSE